MSIHDHAALLEAFPVCPCCHRPLATRSGIAAMAIAAAEAVYGVTPPELRGVGRQQHTVKGRALVAWALRSLGETVSYPVIGRMLGGRDHTTIMNLHRKAIALRLIDQEFALACRAMEIAEHTEAAYADRN